MELVVIGVLWLVLAALAGVWAERKGHNGALFVVLAAALSPLVGLIAAAAVADRTIPRQHPMHAGGVDPNLRPCPHCAEQIQRAAVLCRFCRMGVPALAPAPPEVRQSIDPRAPMMPGDGGAGRVLLAIGIVVLVIVAIIGGVAQLGSSANSTFTTISDSM